MANNPAISKEMVLQLEQLAAAYGYELKPVETPVPAEKPVNTADTVARLARKAKWTDQDIRASVDCAQKLGLKVPGLFQFLKANS